jgi:predicted transcriptional regulator
MEFMELSETELRVIECISHGALDPRLIAIQLKKSIKQVYKAKKYLLQKGFILSGEVSSPTHVSLLIQLMRQYHSLIPLLADSGIKILISILLPKTICEITQETRVKKSMVYRKIKEGLKVSVVIKHKNQYVVNERIWPLLKVFLAELHMFEQNTDFRVPVGSIIYYKHKDEIVFTSPLKLEATETAFSVYEKYGIKLFVPIYFYSLPKQELSLKKIFIHSLYVAEKEKSVRYFTYCALCYIKFKKQLLRIQHPVLENIKAILINKKISGYPSLHEIKEKAELYDIKL